MTTRSTGWNSDYTAALAKNGWIWDSTLHSGLLSARTVAMMHCKCAGVRLRRLSSCRRRSWLSAAARVADVIYRWADISHSMTSAAAAVSTSRCSELKRHSCRHVTSAVHGALRRRVNLKGNVETAALRVLPARTQRLLRKRVHLFTHVAMQQRLKRCYQCG